MVQREGPLTVTEERLSKLSWLQTKLLKHALSFPKVKRVVYSTCSISVEENEQVSETTVIRCCLIIA